MSMMLPRSALVVLDTLNKSGPLPPKEISKKANLPLRTVTFALKRLLTSQLCRRVPNLSDMRRPLYCADREQIRALFANYGFKIV